MARTPAIHAEALFHVYEAAEGNVVALRGLDLEVAEGEVVTVAGPSGSGKTTLLHCLAGLQRPTAGRLRAAGVQLDDARRRVLGRYRAEVVGLVRQHYFRALSGDLRVWELVALKPALLGWSVRRRRARALELLEAVGLADRAGARRSELSGGEQQRVAVCAALAAAPRLLLADEPTGELDEATGGRLLELIRDLAHRQGATVVVVSHDPAVAQISDRVIGIRDGRVVTVRDRAGEDLAVVDPAGLVRLGPETRQRAGIADRVRLIAQDARLVIEPAAPVARSPAADLAPGDSSPPARSEPTAGRPVVNLRDVGRSYPSPSAPIEALAALTLDFNQGLFHVVAGPSGSGKTTLLHLVAGLERPTTGRVAVLGRALEELSRAQLADFRRDHVAIVPQSPALVPFLSALENVELMGRIRGLSARQASTRATAAIAEVGLRDRAGQRAGELSGGERQRVAIARALATKPELILADEPSANLDQANATTIAELLDAATRRHGVTVICATHDPILMTAAHRRVQLHDGRLELEPEADAGAAPQRA
jgi:ABC-type lipoprotein export system ATPase subunit